MNFALLVSSASAAQSAELSAADRVEIQQLIARYAQLLDSGAPDGRLYADLFVPDGALVNPTETITGQAKLAAFAAGYRTSNAGVTNLATNMLIKTAPGGASGRVYVVVVQPGSSAGPGAIGSGGHFEDDYVRTEQGWRFKRRQFVPSRLR